MCGGGGLKLGPGEEEGWRTIPAFAPAAWLLLSFFFSPRLFSCFFFFFPSPLLSLFLSLPLSPSASRRDGGHPLGNAASG